MWIVTQFTIILGIIAFGIWMYCIVTQLQRIADALEHKS